MRVTSRLDEGDEAQHRLVEGGRVFGTQEAVLTFRGRFVLRRFRRVPF